MEIIRNSNKIVLQILGEPKVYKNEIKRRLKNCLIYEINDGIVILNSLTKAIVFLENNEIDEIGNINKYSFLYKNYFFVNEDFDEWKAFKKIKKSLEVPIDDLYLTNLNSFTITSTLKCNARCSYCFENIEKKLIKHHMSEDMAYKIANYILDITPNDLLVNLNWFGGEPLYNIKPINIICKQFKEHNKPFVSSIVTNGYLFNDNLIKKAKSLWNLNSVQITIDGTEDIYNNVKNYIYKNSISPYKKIMDNIQLLIDNNIYIIIRINVDNTNINNINNIPLLIEEIHNKFSNNEYIQFWIYPVFSIGKYQRTNEETTKLLEIVSDLSWMVYNLGYQPIHIPSPNIIVNQCMADNGSSILINTDGYISLCEHDLDNKKIGNILNPLDKNLKEIKPWKEQIHNKKLCGDCPLLCECISLKKCPEFNKCNESMKEWRINEKIIGLDYIVNQYFKNKCNSN